MNFTKTIVNAIMTWVNKRFKENTPDWRQNDPNADGYIRNRTHYTYEDEIVLLPTKRLVEEDRGGLGFAVFDGSALEIKAGQEYKVTFDNTTYSCVGYTDSSVAGCVCLGNFTIAEAMSGTSGHTNTGEPFVFMHMAAYGVACVYTPTVDIHTIKIATIGEKVKKIDQKYLPDLPDMDYVSYDKWQDLTEDQMAIARENIGAGTSNFSGDYRDLTYQPDIPRYVVQYNTNQSLTDDDKSRARNNIGAVSKDQVLSVTEQQTLTDRQKELARNNIGASDFDGNFESLIGAPNFMTLDTEQNVPNRKVLNFGQNQSVDGSGCGLEINSCMWKDMAGEVNCKTVLGLGSLKISSTNADGTTKEMYLGPGKVSAGMDTIEFQRNSAVIGQTVRIINLLAPVDYHDAATKGYVDNTVEGLATEEYVDDAIAAIPTPDVSGQIDTHNTSADAHSDIREAIAANTSAIELLTNGASAEEIDSVNDLIQYVNEHGSEVTGMKADIQDNADAIADKLSYNEQVLTEEQKVQARENIGAASDKSIESITTFVEVPININDEVYKDAHLDSTGKEYDVGFGYGLTTEHYLPVIGGRTVEAVYGYNGFGALNVRVVQYNQNREIIVAPIELRPKIYNPSSTSTGVPTSDTSVAKQLTLNEETAFIRFSVTHWNTSIVKEDSQITISYVEDDVTSYVSSSVMKEEIFVNRNALTKYTFDDIEFMKSCKTLKVGDYCKTNGYYNFGDGGGANYIIVDEVDESAHQEVIFNGLYATLIHGDVINVKQLGAVGYESIWSATKDSSAAIQRAVNLASKGVFIPAGAYKISNTITISNKNNFSIDAEGTEILFDKNDNAAYCFKCVASNQCTFNFGTIQANNGGCLEFYADSDSTAVSYITTNFKKFCSNANCVYVHCDGGYVCELRFNNGRVMSYSDSSSNVGFKIVGTDTCRTDHYVFQNIGIEGVNTGFYFIGVEQSTLSTTGYVECIEITNCRYLESLTTLLKTEGYVRNINISSSCITYARYFDLSEKTNSTIINAPLYESGGAPISYHALIFAGLILYEAPDECTLFKADEFIDLSTIEDQIKTIYSRFKVHQRNKKIKLSKHYGRHFGKNRIIFDISNKPINGLFIYDSEDNLIFDFSNLNAGDIIECQYIRTDYENYWIAIKLNPIDTPTLPIVTTDDNGKLLRVSVDGTWVADDFSATTIEDIDALFQ